MTTLTDAQRGAATAAAALGHAYALWRVPGGESFRMIVATRAPEERPVFGEKTPPGFVLCPFDARDGNLAWHLPADVEIGEAVRYRAGESLSDSPQTEAQTRFAETRAEGPLQAAPSDLPEPEPTERAAYEARVARAVAAIKAGQAEKIVLSRVDPRPLAADHDLRDLAEALARAYPQAFVCLTSAPQAGTWLVATPEILLTADAKGIGTMALAGTQWPEPDADIAALTWPQKIVDEQAVVAREIAGAFADAGIGEVTETPAATVRAANLCHLRSDFHAPGTTPEQRADLLRRLHPTSAVCGMPRAAACDFILAEEGPTRGFYTGYLGPVNIDGETRLQVNLRTARITPTHACLHVGGGIVAASDPATEYEETVQKARTIGAVL
ncbi:chorismate-binding protein [Pseudooceanicola sp.]|uniref:chorismate-binding protein n=1 Tax=Pseudooceanicola sp. TaxID=1914328 RepID=UPI0040593147